ncbi:hypothetical protein SAMN04488128_105125 [Chitinophaga eiseniae]|uniref:Outer membrane protein beta-barrel domain-containing protein n=1 Tax=Chitinophaga eiseniae TaxID=634771 RepID=A0A1T4TI77_9BACT|nr:hypothetical protein [Chitinophaga eiseniae]SKA40127.1 hypothetical protein SAMN04488128_105125 [Chitinophaga eiseniae]
MKKLYIILFLATISGGLYAQTTGRESTSSSKKSEKEQRKLKRISVFREQEEGENLFQRDFSVGARLNTDGWSGFVEMGYRKSRKVVNYFQFEFAEKKDPKETKRQGTGGSGFSFTERPFIYGKVNNFYQAKLGIGQRYLIGGKANKNGVEVDAIYYGGLTLGLLKPYYVNVKSQDGPEREVKYDPNNPDNNFLKEDKIIGAAGFGKGWSDLNFVPGLHARAGLRFDWAHFNEIVSALEVGVNAEVYSKKIQIMAEQKDKQFFFNAYVSLQFGKRWNRR